MWSPFIIFGEELGSNLFHFTFKHAWKAAILSNLVTSKCFPDLTLLHIENQTFFCSMMLLFSFHLLVVRWIDLVIYHLQIYLILMLIFVLCFTERHTDTVLSLLGRSHTHVYSLFWGKNRQHIPVFAKTISSWVQKA